MKKAFLRYDEDDSGEVSARNFERVLDKLGFDLDKDVIEAFDGKYLKFVKCIEGEDDDDDDVDGVLKKAAQRVEGFAPVAGGRHLRRKLRNAADDAGVRLSTLTSRCSRSPSRVAAMILMAISCSGPCPRATPATTTTKY